MISRQGDDESGSATVELALLMPVIMAIVMLAANLGTYWTARQTALHAASAAARIFATTGELAVAKETANVISKDLVQYGGSPPKVDIGPDNAKRKDRVIAEVTYTLPVNLIFFRSQAQIQEKAYAWKEE